MSYFKNNLLNRLVRDERASVSAVSLIFLTVILGIGVIVGLVIVRDHVVQEFGDLGVSLDALDQSFSYRIEVCDECLLEAEYVDAGTELNDPDDAAPACLILDAPPSGENGTRPTSPGVIP